MAIAKLPSYIKEAHGKFGDDIYYVLKTGQFIRKYHTPSNPKTEEQKKVRSLFSEAVKAWQSLSHEKKSAYNNRALKQNYSGYNLFISIYIQGNVAHIYNNTKKLIKHQLYSRKLNTVSHLYLFHHGSIITGRETLFLKKPPDKLLTAS